MIPGDRVLVAHGTGRLLGTVVEVYGDMAVIDVPDLGDTISVPQNDCITN